MSGENCHVKPEPAEASAPVPVVRRMYTLADHQARVAAWQHLAYKHHVVVSFAALCEAVDVVDATRAQARTAAGEIR